MSAPLQLLLSPLIALLAKASVILACGLLLGSIRRLGPTLRHAILLASLCAAGVLPVLSLATPRWEVAILPSSQQHAEPPDAEHASWTTAPSPGTGQVQNRISGPKRATTTNANASRAGSATSARREGPQSTNSIQSLLFFAIWLLGTLVALGRMLGGQMQLRRIAARASVVNDVSWTRILEEEKRLAGVSAHVRLLVSSTTVMPVTWGTRSSVVLLPEDALEWTAEHRRIVLRHELAHIARGDALAQSLAVIACTVYWFHPLALMAAKRMRIECERACDDRVVALGTEPREYASHLLDVARAASDMHSRGLASLAMARPSLLEGRLLAVLDASRPRTLPTRASRVIARGLPLAFAIVGSAFQPVQRPTTGAGDGAKGQKRVPQVEPHAAPVAQRMISLARPIRVGVPPIGAASATVEAPVVAAAVAQVLDKNVDILLRADSTLPIDAPVQLVISGDENLVLVNDRVVDPLDLRAAIELVKQVRTIYGREIPGGSVHIVAPPHRAATMRPSDAEPYAHLLDGLARATTEVINERPAARHLRFEEHPVVEVSVSDSALARLMRKSP